MLHILMVLTGLSFLAVIGTLVMGAVSMKGNESADREKSNKWMQRRVFAQAAAIIFLALTVYMRSKSGG